MDDKNLKEGTHTIIRVSPKLLTTTIAKMNNVQRAWLVETGFKHLLKFSLMTAPHELAYRIIMAYDIENECLNLDEKKIHVTETDVNRVLGLPMGEEPMKFYKGSRVPKSWKAQFGRITPSRIKATDISLKLNKDETASWNFKRNFLVMLGNTIISPPKDAYAEKELARFQGDLDKLYNYNRCSYTIFKLKNAVQVWRAKPSISFTGPLLLIVVSISNFHYCTNSF